MSVGEHEPLCYQTTTIAASDTSSICRSAGCYETLCLLRVPLCPVPSWPCGTEARGACCTASEAPPEAGSRGFGMVLHLGLGPQHVLYQAH